MVTKKLQKSFKWIGIILLLTIHGEIKINSTEQLDFLIKYLIGERGDKINVPEDYFSKRALLRSLMNVRPPLEISEEFLKVQDEFLTA